MVPLPNGHLLITCRDAHKVLELDAREQVVWELNENDLPGNPLRLMADASASRTATRCSQNYLGHGHVGEQPECFK